jgi:hypothetical protein
LKLWEESEINSNQYHFSHRMVSVVFFVMAFFSKSAVLPFPGTLVALSLVLSPPMWSHGKLSKTWVNHWKFSCRQLVVPLIACSLGVVVTVLANTKGTTKDADVHWLHLGQRIHKAVCTLYCVNLHARICHPICMH